MCRILLLLLILLVFSSNSFSQSPFEPYLPSENSKYNNNIFNQSVYDSAGLDSFIVKTMNDYHIVGYSAAIVKDTSVLWQRSYGYANLEQEIPLTINTLMGQASISKTYTAIATLQLYEQGLFNLDDDINAFLPERLQVRNPYYPNDKISVRMLLQHTSSIKDNWNVLPNHDYVGDSPIALDSFLVEYLMPGGDFYNIYTSYYDEKPNTNFHYSNVAFTILALIVENISGMSFDEYCQANLFSKLDMEDVSWFLANLDTNNVTTNYGWDGLNNFPYGILGTVLYPSGQLRTSTADLCNLISFFIHKGTFNDNVILKSSTVDLMTTPYIRVGSWYMNWSGFGMFEINYHNVRFWGNTGGAHGVWNLFLFVPEENWGVALSTNTGYEGDLPCQGKEIIDGEVIKYAEHINEIYPTICMTNRKFIMPGTDSLTISTQIYNSVGDDYTVEAILYNQDSSYTQNFPLYDDGAHGDGLAKDDLWSNQLGPIETENYFTIEIRTHNLSNLRTFISENMASFTTIGPVSINSYKIVTPNDSIVNPGETHRFKFVLENRGQTTTAQSITARIGALDSFATVIGPTILLNFEDIAAGQSVLSSNYRPVKFSEKVPDSTYIKLQMDIFSNDIVFWQDTVSILIRTDPAGEIARTSDLPTRFVLNQNYPNPFNPSTTIEFQIPNSDFTTLKVYDILGKEISTLVSKKLNPGNHTYTFDGNNLASGIYYYQLVAGEYREVKNMILLR